MEFVDSFYEQLRECNNLRLVIGFNKHVFDASCLICGERYKSKRNIEMALKFIKDHSNCENPLCCHNRSKKKEII